MSEATAMGMNERDVEIGPRYNIIAEEGGFAVLEKWGWYHVHSISPLEWILATRVRAIALDCLTALVDGDQPTVRRLQRGTELSWG